MTKISEIDVKVSRENIFSKANRKQGLIDRME
jgi:hypothetical protein